MDESHADGTVMGDVRMGIDDERVAERLSLDVRRQGSGPSIRFARYGGGPCFSFSSRARFPPAISIFCSSGQRAVVDECLRRPGRFVERARSRRGAARRRTIRRYSSSAWLPW